jgi:hypothetical protein
MSDWDIECRIVSDIVTRLLRAGFALSVDNGGDCLEVTNSRDFASVMEHLCITDDATIFAMRGEGDERILGRVYIVHGNGYDCIADSSVSLNRWLEAVHERCMNERGYH